MVKTRIFFTKSSIDDVWADRLFSEEEKKPDESGKVSRIPQNQWLLEFASV